MSNAMVEIRVKDKCSTCAFRSGSYANQDGITLIKAKLCADTATPFLCHEADREAMCAGFTDFLGKWLTRPEYQNQQDWQREVKLKMLEIIDAAEDADKNGLPPPDYEALIRQKMSEIPR